MAAHKSHSPASPAPGPGTMAHGLESLNKKDFTDNECHMERFLIQNEFGQPQELVGEEIVIPGFEELQFILHAWLYDKHGGWAITERSSGKRITSGSEGTQHQARDQLERQLRAHGKDALMRVLGKGKLSS